ncbi:hypothetical protein GCM10022225_00960 [Plantactinospora mayteni]|uniref:LytR family transcriptional regulator n=1 Tax=Plantactinospora mayteni TaxID=566021 RepID=A0ABQ4EYD6_9ACTN|nr:hypothetical protein [Plantactinospora mayteni]GIG99676.1 hypothetical protein Pma05_62490 [Plantactinospora mayteni]
MDLSDDDRTPYRPHGARANRRRTLLIVLSVLLVAALGLTLHAVGVLG